MQVVRIWFTGGSSGRSLGIAYSGMALLSLVVGTISASVPGVDLLGVAAGVLIGVTIVLMVADIVGQVRNRAISRRFASCATVSLVSVLLLIVLVVSGLPLEIRFANAESDFDSVVATCQGQSSSGACLFPGRIGSYAVSTVAMRDNGDLIFYLGGFGLEDSGFYHSASGRRPTAGLDLEAPRIYCLNEEWFAFVSGF